MINVQIPSTIGARRTQAQIWRPTSRTFWLMLALQGLILAAIIVFVLSHWPAATPLTATDGSQQVHDFVLAGDHATDPLIEVAPGVIGRSSSVRGLRLDNQTYYYYFEGRQNHDPLSIGAVTSDQVETLLRDTDGETVLVIYRVIDK